MDIKTKKTIDAKTENIVRPPKEDVIRARTQKKAKKKERAERAVQKEKDEFTENYLRRTAKSDIDYLVDRYAHRPDAPPSVRLHPGTLNFLEKFRPEIFKSMNLQEKNLPSTKAAGESTSDVLHSVSPRAKEKKDS